MIVAEPKPVSELLEMVKGLGSILVVGCKGCVTVCNVGGSKEVGILASTLKIAARKQGREIRVGEHTLERQCDPEYVDELKDMIGDYDAVISLACGVGPQFLSLNGPCGGSNHGKCEISKDVDCIWDIIVRKMMAQGRLEELVEFKPPKSWATARDGGPRQFIREELVK